MLGARGRVPRNGGAPGVFRVVSGEVRLPLELLRWSGSFASAGEVEVSEGRSGGGGMAAVP